MCENILTKIEDKNQNDCNENIPLHIAATKGYFSICKLFIENGMDLNSRNNKGDTPFTLAYEKRHGNVIDLRGRSQFTFTIFHTFLTTHLPSFTIFMP